MNPPLTIDGINETTWAYLYLQARREVGFTASDAVFNRRFKELLAAYQAQT